MPHSVHRYTTVHLYTTVHDRVENRFLVGVTFVLSAFTGIRKELAAKNKLGLSCVKLRASFNVSGFD